MRYDTPMSQPLPVATPAPSTSPSTATPKPTTSAAASKPAPIAPTTPASLSATSTISSPTPLADLPLRQQLKHGLRDMYRSSLSSGRNFAKVGAIFSGTECAIEGLRAKNDIWNGVAGGCITGGVLARSAGPQAAAVGCAGFAVFSAAIDSYMVSEGVSVFGLAWLFWGEDEYADEDFTADARGRAESADCLNERTNESRLPDGIGSDIEAPPLMDGNTHRCGEEMGCKTIVQRGGAVTSIPRFQSLALGWRSRTLSAERTQRY